MNFNGLFYLLLLLPVLIFSIYISKEKVLKDEPIYIEYAIGVTLVLLIWGEIALYLKQWYFPSNSSLGILIFNHPIEFIAQALIIPLFIISLWEFVKKQK